MGSKAKKVFLYKLGWLTPSIWTFTTSTPAALSFHSPRPQLTYSVAYGGLCVRARLTLCAISYTYLCETKAHGVPEKWVWSISSSIRSSCCSLSNWLLLFIDCAVDSATLSHFADLLTPVTLLSCLNVSDSRRCESVSSITAPDVGNIYIYIYVIERGAIRFSAEPVLHN